MGWIVVGSQNPIQPPLTCRKAKKGLDGWISRVTFRFYHLDP